MPLKQLLTIVVLFLLACNTNKIKTPPANIADTSSSKAVTYPDYLDTTLLDTLKYDRVSITTYPFK